MPLDPVLARGLTPITAPQAPDPANQFAKIIQMENLRSQMETNALARQKNQMEMEDRNALRAALASPDPAAALMGIPGGAGEVEARAKLDTAKMERMLKLLSVGNEYLARARDQQSYDAARQAVESLSPGSTRSWAPQYSPEGVQSLLQDAATIRKLNEPTDFERMVRAAGIQPGTPEAQALARRKLDKDVYIAPTEAGQLPADVRTAQWYASATPEQRAAYDKATGKGAMTAYQSAQLEIAQSKEQRDAEKATAEKEAVARALQSAMSGAEESYRLVSDAVGRARGLTSATSTGVGSLIDKLPLTDARALANEVNTIKANLGFDRLRQMREESKTGGALGQVAVKELERLESAVAGLDTGLSAPKVREQLSRIQTHYDKWLLARRDAAKSEGAASQEAPPAAGQSVPTKNFTYVPGKGLVPQ